MLCCDALFWVWIYSTTDGTDQTVQIDAGMYMYVCTCMHGFRFHFRFRFVGILFFQEFSFKRVSIHTGSVCRSILLFYPIGLRHGMCIYLCMCMSLNRDLEIEIEIACRQDRLG